MLTRSQIATQVETISNVTSQRTLVNTFIQVSLDRVYEFYSFPYYLDYKNGVIETVATYSTGTINVYNGSTTIDATGTTLTSSMIGRKIRVQNEKPYYRIVAINAVSGAGAITIDNPYQGNTNTLQSYTIFKDEYLLNADVDKYKSLRQIQNGIMIMDLSPKRFDETYPTPEAYSDPLYAVNVGTANTNYSTGTISASGSTITGNGTLWSSVEGLGRGSKIQVGSNTYTIKSVNSNTSLTVYETMLNIPSNTSYDILLNNIVIQLYQIPDSNRLLYYRYFRIPSPLVNDNDVPDMPYQFHFLLIYGTLGEIMSFKGDINKAENLYESRFLSGLDQMRRKLGSFAPEKVNRRKSADVLKARTIALEPSAFDRRYSSA